MGVKGYPQQQLDEIEPSAVQEIVSSLRDLHAMGQPRSDEEVEQRISQFFEFCQRSSIRPGIESLCLALHVSRQTLWRWAAGIQCSERRQQAIESAKNLITAYLEQASLQGKINPASGIFLLKNWAGYKDTTSFEIEQKEEYNSAAPLSEAEIEANFGRLLSDNTESENL